MVSDIVAVSWQGLRRDDEVLAIVKIEGNLLEARGGKHIAVCGGTDRIEAHRREDIPSRHLTSIVITRQATRRVVVFCIEDIRHTLNGLFPFPDEIVQIGYLMAGFVAMPVTTLCKHRVELGLKLLRTTKHLNESLHIVRHIPGVMTSCPLRYPRLTMDKVRIILEQTAIVLSAGNLSGSMATVTIARLGIDDIAPVL